MYLIIKHYLRTNKIHFENYYKITIKTINDRTQYTYNNERKYLRGYPDKTPDLHNIMYRVTDIKNPQHNLVPNRTQNERPTFKPRRRKKANSFRAIYIFLGLEEEKFPFSRDKTECY